MPPGKIGLCEFCKDLYFNNIQQILHTPEQVFDPVGLQLAQLSPPDAWSASCAFCRLLHIMNAMNLAVENPLRANILAYSYRRSCQLVHTPFASSTDPTDFLFLSTGSDLVDRPTDFNQYALDSGPFLVPEQPDVPEAKEISWFRQLQPTIDFGLLRNWIDTCYELHGYHTETRGPQAWDKVGIFRLINCNTREIVDAGHAGFAQDGSNYQYAALSYVWGKARLDSPGDIKDIHGGMLPHQVPNVVEDAIELVRNLNLKFLWVDRYCIRQHDPNDKQAQISKMDMIYKNAALTIIAAAGIDPSYGLPGVRARLRVPQRSELVGYHKLHVIPPHPLRSILASKWITRAWVYQEAVLSRRRLIFTRWEVFFDCDGMNCREITNMSPNFLQSRNKDENTTVRTIFPILGQDCETIKRHIEQYSGRDTSDPSDILNAILGIFQAYESTFKQVEFKHYWGLPLLPQRFGGYCNSNPSKWTARLLHGFMWRAASPTFRRKRFPSWSWTGWIGPVEFLQQGQWVSDPTISVHVQVQSEPSEKYEPFEGYMQQHINPTGGHSDPGILLSGSRLEFLSEPRTEFLFGPRRLRIHAPIVRLRFKFLDNIPDEWELTQGATSALNRIPGFYVQTRKEAEEYAALSLDLQLRIGSKLFGRLQTDCWECIVVGYDHRIDEGYSTPCKEIHILETVGDTNCAVALVCNSTNSGARRIGLVRLGTRIGNKSALSSERVQFEMWRTEILLI